MMNLPLPGLMAAMKKKRTLKMTSGSISLMGTPVSQLRCGINGIPSTFGGSSVLVHGIDAGRVDLNGTSNVLGRIESRINRVSMDSVQEIQVLEQTYSAQYGQAIGAVIMGRKMFKKLHVFAGAEHPHAAQQPKALEI